MDTDNKAIKTKEEKTGSTDEIFRLIERFEGSGMSRLKLRREDYFLELEKPVAGGSLQKGCAADIIQASDNKDNKRMIQGEGAEHTGDAHDNAQRAEENTEGLKKDAHEGTEVKAPIAGVFYSAPKPGAEDYTAEGRRVQKGEVLGLIEAMKMMNEITAPVSGVVKKIHIKNEEFAEYKQTLIVIV